MTTYSIQVQLTRAAADHSDITQQATELSEILRQAGYGHIATVVLDDEGEKVAEFAIDDDGWGA